MDFIKGYNSDDSFLEDEFQSDCDETPTCSNEELDTRTVRKVYLITYSQAELARFPTRRSFVDAVLYSFHDTPANVVQWSCSLEQHAKSGVHYHMAIKLDKNQRWLASKRILLDRCGISVHFSSIHRNYYSAWQYVTKEDEEFLESLGHPDLGNLKPPKTTMASIANKAGKRKRDLSDDTVEVTADSDEDDLEQPSVKNQTKGKGRGKKKRITAYELSEIIVAKKIKSRTELLALAREQKNEGKTDIAEFIVNRGTKVVAEVLETAWEMEKSTEDLERQTKTRIEVLQEFKNQDCVENCSGQWLECAKEVLEKNGVSVPFFSCTVFELLNKGRGKYRNLMIVGPANCGKTFLFNPLTVIYKTFCNPACTSFAWVGAEKSECIFLNDFRWCPAIIQWSVFLLLLEAGQLVHLPAPKSHYAKDIVFNSDTPIFATGKNPIMFIKNGAIDERESEMMSVRWVTITFHAQIPQSKQKEIPPCGKCFARLVLDDQIEDV